jgi:hypothetical protein
MITQKATRSLERDGSEAQIHLANLPAASELSSALDFEYERMVFQWVSARVRDSQGQADTAVTLLRNCKHLLFLCKFVWERRITRQQTPITSRPDRAGHNPRVGFL